MAQSVAAFLHGCSSVLVSAASLQGSGLTLTLTPALEQRCVVVDQGGLSISSDRAKLFKMSK